MLTGQVRFSEHDGVLIFDEMPVFQPQSEPLRSSMETWILQEMEFAQKSLNVFEEISKEIVMDTQLKTKCHDSSNNEIEADICSICQTEYEGTEKIASLKCEHEFHDECIRKWLILKNVCPLCKSPAIDFDAIVF